MLRLLQVELLGFKSFPHKTVFELDRGVSCVVGPNGSGKSNLADAIHFAFGSQSARELRAAKLAGLIFAGTEQMRPLNLASVTLTFERTAEDAVERDELLQGLAELAGDELELPELTTASRPAGSQLIERGGHAGAELTRYQSATAPADYDRTPDIVARLENLAPGERVSVTRRLFRDGGGGYYLNGEAVRLKDIDRLFSRFNLGRYAVFSINQGEVEKKVLETPQELRDWLAEATGVALLLAQKERAQTKLKRTRDNLERLEDIRSATRELVEDLAGQRQRAEEHLKLKAELRAVELNEIKREVELAQRQQESAAHALEELTGQLAAQQQEKQQVEAQLLVAQQRRAELERELAGTTAKLEGQRTELAELRQQSAVARERSTAAEAAIVQAGTDAAEAGRQEEQLAGEQAAATQALEAARAETAGLTEEERQCRQALEQAQVQLREITAQQAEASNRAFEFARRQAEVNNDLTALERNERQLAGQLEARQEQLSAARERLKHQEEELALEDENCRNLAAEIAGRQARQQEIQEQLSAAAAAIQAAADVLSTERDTLAELKSRQATLAELDDGAAGGGAAHVLATAGLAERLQRTVDVTFPAELRAAFTRLLAPLSEALAGPAAERGSLLTALRQEGEVLLLSGTEPPAAPHPQSIWPHLAGAPAVLAALRAQVGEVALAADLATAEQMLHDEPGLTAVVLADGSALIGRSYAYLGRPSGERVVQVARRSDLAQLEREIALAAERAQQAEQALAAARSAQAKLQWERDEGSAELAAAAQRLKSAQALGERLKRELADRRDELQLLERQTVQLDADRAKLDTARPALAAQLAELQAAISVNEQQSAALTAQRAEHEQRLEQARQAHSDASSRLRLAEQRASHLEQVGFDFAERRANLRARRTQLEQRAAQLKQEQERSGQLAVQAAARAEELAGTLEQSGDALGLLKREREAAEQDVEQSQARLLAAGQALNRLEQDQLGLDSQRDRAAERLAEQLRSLAEDYELTLSQLLADPTLSATPVGAQLDASEAGRGKLREEKARLKNLLDELGTVNLLSIEQHSQHAARLAFLDSQAEDLARAVNDLSQLVFELDQATAERYRASLSHIESRFNELFHELFEGGWARLRFDENVPLVEAGVEIEVQLPGGRRHSLRSLSGGQRSLICLALFFAVHAVRSPGFCILDEADAALDDINVARYIKLIRRFGQSEQFIVITHNKRTMETADKLVGVVSRPKGVSNLLSVDLKDARKLVDKGAA